MCLDYLKISDSRFVKNCEESVTQSLKQFQLWPEKWYLTELKEFHNKLEKKISKKHAKTLLPLKYHWRIYRPIRNTTFIMKNIWTVKNVKNVQHFLLLTCVSLICALIETWEFKNLPFFQGCVKVNGKFQWDLYQKIYFFPNICIFFLKMGE